jgi:eukaryotic-like serine/threonine-protein kinase
LLLAAVGISGLLVGGKLQRAPIPSFHQLTFRRGAVFSAKFAPGGQVVYSAAWEGTPVEIFSMRPEGTESRSLGLPSADILAISSPGEMAISLRRRIPGATGTLAQVPFSGGAPREIADNVLDADWTPDGASLAAVHAVGTHTRLELPLGKVLYETDGAIDFVRVSPKGKLVAFFEHPSQWDDSGSVAIVDLTGKKTTISSGWVTERGLAWSPTGNELWFTASRSSAARALYAVSLSGKERLVTRVPGSLTLHDISRDGSLLISRDSFRFGIMALPPGASQEQELGWLDHSHLADLSPDGATLLFGEYGGDRVEGSVYLRKVDGSPAVRLGSGNAVALSPDGKWVLTFPDSSDQRLILLPSGAGEAKSFDLGTIHFESASTWSPNERIIFVGKDGDHGIRSYVQDLGGGKPRPFTPEGTAGDLLSPDGRLIIARTPDQKIALYPVDGGEPRPVSGIATVEDIIRWSAGGKSLYVRGPEPWPAKVYRLDLSTGHRSLWKELTPHDSAGLMAVTSIRLTPNGNSYAYAYVRLLSDLYLVDGLR